MEDNILNTLYMALLEQKSSRNRFRVDEFVDEFFDFFSQCACFIEESRQDEVCDRLSSLCENVRKTAFEVGFYAAVELLTK